VSKKDEELDDLNFRQMTLPPQILLDGWTKCGKEVVKVHNSVNEGVHTCVDNQQFIHVISKRVETQYHHENVVNEMEEGYLTVLLPKDEEDSIKKIYDFRPSKQECPAIHVWPNKVCFRVFRPTAFFIVKYKSVHWYNKRVHEKPIVENLNEVVQNNGLL